jgi:hypothetical protein
MFKLATGASWLAGSMYICNRYKDDREALAEVVTTVVLPAGLVVKEIIFRSVNIVIRATTLDALEELWKG